MMPILLAALILVGVAAASLATLYWKAVRSVRGMRRTARLHGIKPAHVTFQQWFRFHSYHGGYARALMFAPLALFGFPILPGFYQAAKYPNAVHLGPGDLNWFAVPIKITTATNVRSGRVLIRGAADDEAIIATAAARNILLVCGRMNITNPAWDETTAPAANDLVVCHVLSPGQFYKLRNGAALVQGDQAQWGTTGLAALAAAAAGDTGKRICRVTETKDGSGTENDITVVAN